MIREYVTACGLFVFAATTTPLVVWISRSDWPNSEGICATLLGLVFWISLAIPDNQDHRSKYELFCIRSACVVLGLVSGFGACGITPFSVYSVLLSFFHLGEFVIPVWSGKRASFDLFLLNHGKEYAFAYSISALEYFVSPVRLPSFLIAAGLFISVIGLVFRAWALSSAGLNFTHAVATKKTVHHTLVKNGPYKFMRHPGYCGWFVWVVGSQLLLGNLVSLVGFSIVTYIFFKSRIEFEEEYLVRFFGTEYEQYRLDTPISGVPYI